MLDEIVHLNRSNILSNVYFWVLDVNVGSVYSGLKLVYARDKITLKVKEFFTPGTKRIWCVVHSMNCEIRIYIPVKKTFLKPTNNNFTTAFTTENMVSFKEV